MQFFLPSLWKIDRNYLKIHDPTFKKKFDLHKDAMADGGAESKYSGLSYSNSGPGRNAELSTVGLKAVW